MSATSKHFCSPFYCLFSPCAVVIGFIFGFAQFDNTCRNIIGWDEMINILLGFVNDSALPGKEFQWYREIEEKNSMGYTFRQIIEQFCKVKANSAEKMSWE